jgi:hypothetical protein
MGARFHRGLHQLDSTTITISSPLMIIASVEIATHVKASMHFESGGWIDHPVETVLVGFMSEVPIVMACAYNAP